MPWMPALGGFRRFVPSMTALAHDAVAETLAMAPPGASIVDLGAGGRRITPDTFTVDSNAATRPDLLCDLHEVPLESDRFDVTFCTGTLEHVHDPVRVAREVVRVTRPGGLVLVDVPFMQGFHADPTDFRRWTLPGLRLLCTDLGLAEIRSGVHLGPGSAVTWVVGEYARVVFGNGAVGKVAKGALRLACRPLLLADPLVVRRPEAHRIASGVFVLSRKPAA